MTLYFTRKKKLHSSRNLCVTRSRCTCVSKRLHYACRPVATPPPFPPLLQLSVTIPSTHPPLGNCETLTSFSSLKALYIPCRLLAIASFFLFFGEDTLILTHHNVSPSATFYMFLLTLFT